MLSATETGCDAESSEKRDTSRGGAKAGPPVSEPHSGGVGEVTVGTDSGGSTGPPEQLGPLQGLCGRAGSGDGVSIGC